MKLSKIAVLYVKLRYYTQCRLYATPGGNWEKSKQMLSSTQRPNIGYLKSIGFFNPCYHPKIIGHILKSIQMNKCGYFNASK